MKYKCLVGAGQGQNWKEGLILFFSWCVVWLGLGGIILSFTGGTVLSSQQGEIFDLSIR
jgi:hypothetical protein